VFAPSTPPPEPAPPEPAPSEPRAEQSTQDGTGAPGEGSAPAFPADGRGHRLDPRSVPCSRISGGIFAAVVLVVGALALGFLALANDPNVRQLVLLGLVWLALVAAAASSAWFLPPRRYRHCSWRLSAFGLEIRRGVWFRHWISLPRARVQHTDVERGPLGRRFGLATLIVHTAGQQDSEVRLEGLAHETALAIRDHLLGAGERGARVEGDGA
jgi:membrane protein YdbS with pleckstrin-like domain